MENITIFDLRYIGPIYKQEGSQISTNGSYAQAKEIIKNLGFEENTEVIVSYKETELLGTKKPEKFEVVKTRVMEVWQIMNLKAS